MDSNSDPAESKNTPLKFPTLSMHSDRPGSARRKRKSRSLSSHKSTYSAERSEAEVPQKDEDGKPHDAKVKTVGLAEGSSLPSKHADGSIPVNNLDSSLQTLISLLQEHLVSSKQVPGKQQTDNSGHVDRQKEEEMEEEKEEAEIPEVERDCRRLEKQCSDVVPKPVETDPWPELSDILRKHDEDQVKAQNENIDTLLVLSGLFSAVVATLSIEGLKQLQRDPTDTTVQLLQQISMQLSSLSINSGFINSTYIPPPPSPFTPSPNAVAVNVLWFISLALSLITASLGMLVKQWFREFLAKSNVSPEQCCQVRQFRIPGLRKYRVAEIAGFLPIILQTALVLFFIGLILFIRPIHTSVANFISVVVGIWLSFIVITTLLPLFSPSCPYKTPILKSIFFHTRTRMSRLYEWGKDSVIGSHFHFLPNQLFVEESTSDMSVETRIAVLRETFETFRDTQSLSIVIRCIDLNLPRASLRMITLFVERMHGSEVTLSSDLGKLFEQVQFRLLLKSIVDCLRKVLIPALRKDDPTRLTQNDAAATVLLPSSVCLNCLSIPHDPRFTSSLILLKAGLPSRKLPKTIDKNRRTTGDDGSQWWKDQFSRLTGRLAESLQSISYPEAGVATLDVFQAQCTLDMAMRLHTKVPGIVDKSLFQALHDCSIKMFGIEAKYRYWYENGDIRRRDDAPATDDVPGNIPDADWKKLLDEKEGSSVPDSDEMLQRKPRNLLSVYSLSDEAWLKRQQRESEHSSWHALEIKPSLPSIRLHDIEACISLLAAHGIVAACTACLTSELPLSSHYSGHDSESNVLQRPYWACGPQEAIHRQEQADARSLRDRDFMKAIVPRAILYPTAFWRRRKLRKGALPVFWRDAGLSSGKNLIQGIPPELGALILVDQGPRNTSTTSSLRSQPAARFRLWAVWTHSATSTYRTGIDDAGYPKKDVWHTLHGLFYGRSLTRTRRASPAIQIVAGACLQGKMCLLPPLFLSLQDPAEMATASEMSTYESNTQKSPSPSRRSSRSNRTKRTSRSSSSKRARSAENEITEVHQPAQGDGTPKGEHEPVDSGRVSPLLSKPPSQSNASNINTPSLDAAVISQPNQTTQVSGGELHNACDAPKNRSGEGDEEKVTSAERFCRKKEKEFPQIILKPENANAWPKLSDTLREHDEDRVETHNENIDTLLVLSGLFSAVVTTLIIEALKRLQQDPADTTAQLLLQISMQLTSLSVNPGFINSTYIPPQPLPFSPPPNSVLVVILWSIALVLSLVTASLGMLVKQWLREFLSKSNVSPEQCCQVRLFRIPGLRKYKVAEIAGLLPILLQIALVLFFVALILFVQSIHTSVAIAISVVVGIWLIFVVGATLLPIFSPSCPYKTPFLKAAFLWIRNRLAQMARTSLVKLVFPKLPNPLFVEERTDVITVETKVEVLKEAYETFHDIQSWEIATCCVDLNSPRESLQMLYGFVKRMHDSEINPLSDLGDLFDQARLRFLLISIVSCLRQLSVFAVKDGFTRWELTDVVQLVTFHKLYRAFKASWGSDAALDDMADLLTSPEHILSICRSHAQFASSYILSISGLSPDDLPEKIGHNEMWNVAKYAASALDGGSANGNGAGFKCSDSLPHLLEICRISFLCAGRTTEDGCWWWEDHFFRFKFRLVKSLLSISYSERYVDPEVVFRAQCTLDMAMRLRMKVPSIVDESLCRALHECSIKSFTALANSVDWYEGGDIKRRYNGPAIDDAPSDVPDADWKKLLDKKEEHVGIQIRDDGNYGDEWYDDDLQNSCKQRIEFMWSKLSEYHERGFRQVFNEFEVEPKT
ncbi:hypothetical protein NLI96_g8538 [Meripilus lineatus]|uniref:DUF6535 domain-containing protein n=1 Tax=Meripilus lineatus TaxID=2056292 RepID=A0AAD5UX56_9APHY|nr:hypothetical protein NLI96_g8538 [Physisporinus lineatus]